MRKCVALALLVTFSWIGGLGQDARAGVTIDVQFFDQASPSGITIPAGDPGPGCWFDEPFGYLATIGYCMEVILTTTEDLFIVSGRVGYDSDNGLGVWSFKEWQGVDVLFDSRGIPTKDCAPMDGVTDDGTEIGEFDCVVGLPLVGGDVIRPGTYRIGTIIWDTSGTTSGQEDIFVLITGVGAVINGNVVDYTGLVVPGAHILNIIPEPGTAALLGLGLVGLILAGRRRRG